MIISDEGNEADHKKTRQNCGLQSVSGQMSCKAFYYFCASGNSFLGIGAVRWEVW